MAIPHHASLEDRIWHYGSRALCFEVLGFLMYLEDLGRAERVPCRPVERWTGR